MIRSAFESRYTYVVSYIAPYRLSGDAALYCVYADVDRTTTRFYAPAACRYDTRKEYGDNRLLLESNTNSVFMRFIIHDKYIVCSAAA